MKCCSSTFDPTTKLCMMENMDLNFKDLDMTDLDIFRSYFAKYPSRSCDFSIGGVFIWKELFNYQYTIIKDSLIIKGYLPEKDLIVYYSPIGKMTIEELKDIIDKYNYRNVKKTSIILNEEEIVGESEIQLDEINYLPEFKEYLYPIEKFCDFPGKKMEKKRNHLHFFQKNYNPFEVKIISSEIISKLIDFTKEFEAGHNDSEFAEYECRQIENVLENFDLYPFEGIYLLKDGDILGYSFGEKSGDTFIIHAEKGDIRYRGVYQEIASELAKYVAKKYPDVLFLNREDDMEDESLRQSKMSYHPTLFIHKRIV